MFVVKKKIPRKDHWCVLLCSSERQGKKVRQKTIKYFGIAHNKEELQVLVEQARRELQKQTQTPPELPRNSFPEPDPCHGTLLREVVEVARVTEGFHDVMGPCFDKLGLASLLTESQHRRLKDLVMARIAHPTSKLHTSRLMQTMFDKELSVDQIYRLMDALVDLEGQIQLKVFQATAKKLKNAPINLLLFDVTTLYFESQKGDGLREVGYSKDHKVGEVQVVLALATTAEGSPVGYHLFPGNTAEVHTLLECITKWRAEFQIKNTIVVADRAMLSEANLSLMESENLTYVVAAKLRSLPKQLKADILAKNQEASASEEQEFTRIQEHEHGGRRLIVSYSRSRADKDRGDRERLVQQLRKKLEVSDDPQGLISNRGYVKYVDKVAKGKVTFNADKLVEEEKWDGLHGVITNDKGSAAIELLERYRHLWVIEESFRINKHTLGMRPIYHFSPKRIRAHILICYLAFAVTRYVHQDVNIYEQPISIEMMREALARVEVSILKSEEQERTFILPAPLSKEAVLIYRAAGLTRSATPRLRSFAPSV